MPDDPERHLAFCALCGDAFWVENILGHLLDAHDVDVERDMLRWPDGEPVVISEPDLEEL